MTVSVAFTKQELSALPFSSNEYARKKLNALCNDAVFLYAQKEDEGGFHYLFMTYGEPKPSKKYLDALKTEGYKTEICHVF